MNAIGRQLRDLMDSNTLIENDPIAVDGLDERRR